MAVVLLDGSQHIDTAEANGIIFTVDGTITGNGTDTYDVFLEQGKMYNAFVTCPDDSDLNPLVDVYDPFGLLLTFENFTGGGCNGRSVRAYFGAEFGGTYSFDIYDLGGDAANGGYTFRIVGLVSSINDTFELTDADFNNDVGENAVVYETMISAGTIVVANAFCPTDDGLDPFIFVVDSDDNVIAFADDEGLSQCFFGPFAAPLLVFTAPVTDTYTFYVGSLFGLEGVLQFLLALEFGTSPANNGMIDVPVGTVGYTSPGGDVYGDFVNDADGTGSDAMQVISFYTDENGTEWAGLWLGGGNPIWIPVSSGVVIRR